MLKKILSKLFPAKKKPTRTFSYLGFVCEAMYSSSGIFKYWLTKVELPDGDISWFTGFTDVELRNKLKKAVLGGSKVAAPIA